MSEDFTARATCECYYKFENSGDLGEDNQNQIDLTNNNGVTQSATIPSGTYASPSATKSGSFTAASSMYLSATHNDSTEVDDLTAITALAWVRFASSQTGHCIFAKGGGGDQCHVLAAAGTMQTFRTYFAGTNYAQTYAFSTNTWYFMVAAYSQTTDLMTQYIGTEEGQVAVVGTPQSLVDATASTAGEFRIGQINWGGYYLDGLLCEAAIFSEELSLAELREIQADGIEGTPAGNPYYAYAQQ